MEIVRSIYAFEIFKVCLQTENQEEFVSVVTTFYKNFRLVAVKGVFAFEIQRTQQGLLKELADISTEGLRKSMDWHRKELIFYVDELLGYLEYYNY